MYHLIRHLNISLLIRKHNNVKELWDLLAMRNMDDLMYIYNLSDVNLMSVIANSRFKMMHEKFTLEPKNFSSMATFSKSACLLQTKFINTQPQTVVAAEAFENALSGGFSSTPLRVGFNTN